MPLLFLPGGRKKSCEGRGALLPGIPFSTGAGAQPPPLSLAADPHAVLQSCGRLARALCRKRVDQLRRRAVLHAHADGHIGIARALGQWFAHKHIAGHRRIVHRFAICEQCAHGLKRRRPGLRYIQCRALRLHCFQRYGLTERIGECAFSTLVGKGSLRRRARIGGGKFPRGRRRSAVCLRGISRRDRLLRACVRGGKRPRGRRGSAVCLRGVARRRNRRRACVRGGKRPRGRRRSAVCLRGISRRDRLRRARVRGGKFPRGRRRNAICLCGIPRRDRLRRTCVRGGKFPRGRRRSAVCLCGMSRRDRLRRTCVRGGKFPRGRRSQRRFRIGFRAVRVSLRLRLRSRRVVLAIGRRLRRFCRIRGVPQRADGVSHAAPVHFHGAVYVAGQHETALAVRAIGDRRQLVCLQFAPLDIAGIERGDQAVLAAAVAAHFSQRRGIVLVPAPADQRRPQSRRARRAGGEAERADQSPPFQAGVPGVISLNRAQHDQRPSVIVAQHTLHLLFGGYAPSNAGMQRTSVGRRNHIFAGMDVNPALFHHIW